MVIKEHHNYSPNFRLQIAYAICNNMKLTTKKKVLRSPRLDTVKMVEEFIKEHDGEFKKRKLWESLPKKMMYQTFCTVFDYLAEKRWISIDAEGKIGWIYYPESARKWLARKDLRWKPR